MLVVVHPTIVNDPSRPFRGLVRTSVSKMEAFLFEAVSTSHGQPLSIFGGLPVVVESCVAEVLARLPKNARDSDRDGSEVGRRDAPT